MSLLGIHLTIMIGPTIAVPAPPLLIEALDHVEVTHYDEGRSGFQMTFQVGRSGPLDLFDYQQLLNPLLLKAFNRVVIVVRFNVLPEVLMDGVITDIQLVPSNEPGRATLTVTGEDLSVLMSMNDYQTFPWPSLSDDTIVKLIVAKYAQYAIVPTALPPVFISIDPPTRHVPVQDQSDLDYILCLAAQQGYVFFVEPGPLINSSTAYWGPPPRIGLMQKALSVNMGPSTNVESISFGNNALSPTLVMGRTQDSETNLPLPVTALPTSTRVPLASQPAILFNQPNVRRSRLPVTQADARRQSNFSRRNGGQIECDDGRIVVGVNLARAMALAQAIVDTSTDNVVTATGELDALQFGEFLKARKKVGVRGVGFSYDGEYYVKTVTHSIRKGEYKQRFTLTREGTGSLTPLVRPS
ncbi:MAG: hypothetical protein WCF57_08615 [Pyrinomonadaceae bacterium]